MLPLVLALAAPKPDLAALDRDLRRLCAPFQGRVGYHLRMLEQPGTIGFRDDERYPTASTIKTALAVHAVREVDAGRLAWDTKHPLPDAKDRNENDASEWAYWMKDGLSLNLDGYVTLMITVSDNLTTRVLREWLGTVNVNRSLEALKIRDTLLLASAPKEETRLRRLNGQFGMGMTSPRGMADLLESIYRRRAASVAGCERLIRTLQHQYWDDWIGQSVPPGVAVACKSGAISRSRSDTAIVFGPRPYILTIYTDNQKDRRWTGENEGDRLLAKIATRVWNGVNPDCPYTPPPGFEKFLPTGGGVE